MVTRVLLTTPSYPPFNSGLGNAVQHQAIALARAGCEVTVATGGPARATRHDEMSGARVECFAVDGAAVLFNPVRGQANEYVDYLLQSRFDLVLFNAWQTWSTDLALPLLERIAGRKLLYSHCISTNLKLPGRFLRSWVKFLAWRPYWYRLPGWMKKLDGLLFLAPDGCDSRFDDLRLAKRLGLPCHIVPNALSSAASARLALEAPTYEAREQLVAIGSWEWFKGHDFVLRAYAASALKNRVPLKLFGQSFTAYTAQLRALSDSLGLSPELVSFHEGVSGSELLAECARARVLVSGSWTECQPLVLIDALACGTPFIARATGCIPDLAGGIAVSTEQQAAQQLDRLWQNAADWNALSAAGRAGVRAQHDPDVFAATLLNALGITAKASESGEGLVHG